MFTDDVDNKQYSGLKNIEIIYSRLKEKNESADIKINEYSKLFPIQLDDLGLYTIEDENICKNNSYKVNIICYDNAIKNNDDIGNYTNQSLIIYGINKDSIEKEHKKNYVPERTNDGFKIQGTVVYNIESDSYSNFEGEILLPDDFNALIKYNGERVTGFVPKPETVEFNESIISLAKSNNKSGIYSVKFADIEFSCENIGYSVSDGLIFYNILYNQNLIGNTNKDIKFSLGNTQINSNLKLTTSICETSDIKVKEDNSVYVFNDVEKIQFIDGIKNITGRQLNTAFVFTNPDIVINNDNKNIVLLDKVLSTKDSVNANFKVGNNIKNILSMNEVEYTIEEASIINNEILIKKASTILSINNTKYILILNDFKIDSKGNVNKFNFSKHVYDMKEPNKEVSEITDGTVTLIVNEITLDSNGHLCCESGKYKNIIGEEYLTLKTIELRQNYFDYSNTIIEKFIFKVFNYSISPENITATKDYIIVNGKIVIWNKTFFFNNLQYCPATGKIENEVILYESDGITTGSLIKDAKEYGSAVTYTNIKIRPEGIYADAEIPLGGADNESRVFSITGAKINSDGSIESEATETEQKFNYGTYEITATTLGFNGSKVTVEKGTIEVKDKGFSKGNLFLTTIPLKDLSFNYTEEKTAGVIQETGVIYNKNGWKLSYTGIINITNEGITGQAIAERNKGSYSIKTEFTDTTLNSKDEIICRNVTGSNNLLGMNGISYTVNSALIENKTIKINEATGTIRLDTKDYGLKIENIELREEGNIIFTEGVSKVSSINSNVTTITDGTVEIKIGNLKISENGELYGETGTYKNKSGDSVLTLSGKIKIDSNSFDYSAVKINPFNFSWKGYEIKSLEATACKEYVTITRGTGIVHGKTFSFKDLEYIPINGEIKNEVVLYESDGTTLGNLIKDIKGYGTTVKYTNIKIKPEGIYADAEITLPGALNEGKKINIQSVKIHSNGNIEARVTEAAQKFIYGTYEITATTIGFDGSKVTVEEGKINVKNKGFSKNSDVITAITFGDLSFNYTEEKTAGVIQETGVIYNKNGWKLSYTGIINITNEGITGQAIAERNKGSYSIKTEFTDTTLNSKDEIICRNVTGSNNLLGMNGISYTVNSALIENKTIKINEATGTIRLDTKDYGLKIENIELREEGNIIFTEGVSKVSSINSNVTTITDGTVEIKIGNLKISENGELYGETGTYKNKSGDSVLTLSGKIKIDSNSFDYSAVKINPFNFSWKGYEIKSLEATACKEYVTITRGTGIVHGKTFSFKDLEYIPINGEIKNEVVLYESDGTTLGNLIKDIKGYGTTVKYTNIKIKPEGIYADAEITLPGALNEGKKINIQSVKIHSNGNIEARVTEAAQKFIYGTYEITASIIAFDGSKVTVEKGIIDVKDKGFSNGNMSLLSLTVENLSFNYNKNLENGSIINTQLSYTFDGWNFNYSDTPVLTIDGIKGKGNIRKETEEYIYKFEFSNFVVNANKVIDSGNAENGLESNYFIKNNYLFKLNDASFVKNNNKYVLKSNNPKIDVNTYNSLTLVFGETLINSDSTIISSEKGIQVPGSSFISANGYIINVTTAELNNKEIKLNGTLSTDELKSISQFNSSEMSLYSDFVVETTKNDKSSIIYQYNGWTIYGTDVEYHYDRIIINKNKVNFRGVDIELGKLEFNSYYELEKSTTNVQNIPVSLLSSTYSNSDSIIKYTKFTDEGLVASIDVTLPNPFNNCTIRFDEVYLQSDNNFYVKTIKQRKEFNITESFKVELQDIIIGSFGLKAGYISFTLPPINPNDSPVIILLQGLEILEKNGNLKILIEGSAISPFTIFDTTFGIQNFSISENGYSFTGYTILPSKLPGVLSGMMIGIDKFNIGLNGEITHMGIKLVGTYTIPMGEGFSLNVSNITLDIESVQNEKEFVLLFDDAYLLFPPEYKIQNVKVQNIKYNITKKDFDFDNIKADTAFDAEISGIKFILSQLQIKKNKEESCYDISLYANAEFGKDFPLFLQKQENGVGPNVSGSVTFSTNKSKILKEIEVNASNLNGPITKENNLLNLKDGSAKINISGDKGLVVGILGKLEFTENAPDGIKGLTVDIEKFEFDGSKPAITEMKAKGMFETINISNVELKNLTAEIDYNETKQQEGFVSFSGKLKIPDVLPNETTTNGNNKIGGSVIDIKKFKIGFNSTVEFAASYNCESSVTIGEGLILSNIAIGINYENKKITFQTAAKMKLDPNKFKDGLGNLTTSIDILFDGSGIISGYAALNISDGTKLFNTFTTKNVELKLTKSKGANNFELDFTGNLQLPGEDKLPKGLANSIVKINQFHYTIGGELKAFNASYTTSKIPLYDALTITSATVGIQLVSGKKDFYIDIEGGLKINENASLPTGLKGKQLKLTACRFQVGSENKIVAFNAEFIGSCTFNVMEGLQLSIDKLGISSTGFSCAATANIKVKGLELDTTVGLTNLQMDWKGNVKGIEGGLVKTTAKIAGFTGNIENLRFIKDSNDSYGFRVELAKASLTLPSNVGSIGGKSLGIKNAKIANGKFSCQFDISQLMFDIAGFTLLLNNPDFNFNNNEIIFSSVSMKMPAKLLAASIALNGVKISAKEGLKFQGGSFRIPDFGIGQGVKFTNIYVNFVLNGSEYSIEGSGGLSLANAGEMFASLSFTNVSDIYPIGIKSAYFSFEAKAGRGIDLGTTGLVLSGIRGGLAFGNPDDVPANMRYMFENKGIRIQLGLTIKDKLGGNLISMQPTTWIDVKNFAWAFTGKLYVLSGTLNLSAQADAALSKYGFYTGMAFQLKVVKGSIEFYVFNSKNDGKTKFSGTGNVQFGLSQGSLVNKSIKIFKKRIGIILPPSDLWLGRVQADFGDFKNGKRGFKAYASFSGFGEFGLFVGDGNSLKIGGVSDYTIYKPENSVPILNSIGVVKEERKLEQQIYAANLNFVGSIESENEKNKEKSYAFTIKGRNNPGVIINKLIDNNEQNIIRNNIHQLSSNYGSILKENNQETESGFDRIIFLCAYEEGDPEFCAVSPSGKEYHPGDPFIETTYMENYVTFIVYNPEAGNWEFKVRNIEEGLYEIDMLTVDKIPDVKVNEPEWKKKSAGEYISVSGSSTEPNATIIVYAAESTDSPMFEIAELKADENGYYSDKLSTESLKDGEYYICVQAVAGEDNISKTSYSQGTYLIDRSNLEMKIPSNFNVTERESSSDFLVKELIQVEDNQLEYAEVKYNSLYAKWNDTNGSRTEGFNLKIETEDETRLINVGNVLEYTVSFMKPGTKAYVSVQAYDYNGKTSDFTEPVLIDIGGMKPTINKPIVTENELTVIGQNCQIVTGELKVNIIDYQKTGTNMDYIRAKVLSVNNMDETGSEYFSFMFDDFVEINEKETLLPWTISINDICPKGIYKIKGQIVNEGNLELTSDFVINLNVKYPIPVINSVEPSEIDGRENNTVVLYGEGFITGTRYYFDEKEITLSQEQDKLLLVNQRVINIPECTKRGLKEIKAIGPDGDIGIFNITVKIPDWEAYSMVESVTLYPGEKTVFPITIESLDDYNGIAVFTNADLPTGFSVVLPEIEVNTVGEIELYVDETVTPGNYTVKVHGNNRTLLDLNIKVLSKEAVCVPQITQINPYSAFTGTEVTIYGTGFGETGRLIYNDEEIEVDEWSNTAVSFIVKDNMKSGILHIENKNGVSNSAKLYVHERGFSIRPLITEVNLTRKIKKTIPVAINGYAEKAYLELNYAPGLPIKAMLSSSAIIPNGKVDLILEAEDTIENGEYKIVILGTAGTFSTSKEITITIGDRLAISTLNVYEGKVGIPYKAELKTQNATGQVTFSCINNSRLQAGLQLNKNGIISGTPTEDGLKIITVRAEDEDGQITTKEIQITVTDNAWATKNKDGGNSRSTTADMPSIDNKDWIVNLDEENENILASGLELFLYNTNTVTAYNDRGRFNWSKKLEIEKVQISGSYLFVLGKDKVLYAIDKLYGNVSWKINDVNTFTAGNNLLITKESDRYSVINTLDGTLIETKENLNINIENTIWVGNQVYEYSGNRIRGVYLTESKYETTEEIMSVSADAQGFVIATKNELIVLNSELEEIAKLAISYTENCKTALDITKVFVASENKILAYSRDVLELQWIASGAKEFAIAKEKVITISGDSITIYNEYNGKKIWGEEGSYTSLALYGENIYAQKGNTLIAYSGNPNATPPETQLSIEPSEPNGNNGWYKETQPILSVLSEDKETYVEKLLINMNDEGWNEYMGEDYLPEGITTVLAYGVDSRDYHGNIESLTAKVDIRKPVSTYSITNRVDVNDWISENVKLVLTAEDDISGIDCITINGNTYTGPIDYTNEGIYEVVWKAKDNAGNEEEPHSITLKIDKYIPTVTSSYRRDKGIAIITLEANDSFSGVDYIEYAIDGKEIRKYEEPIIILAEGKHTVQYEAFDKSGKSSGIKELKIDIPKETERGKVLAFTELNGESESVNDQLGYGSMLYRNDFSDYSKVPSDFWSKAYFNTLPRYVLNSEYIQVRGSKMHLSGERIMTWHLKRDAIMYMFAGPEMKVDSRWILIEENIGIQSNWYSKGWNLYMRRGLQNEKIEVQIDSDVKALPIIAARELPIIRTEITMVRNGAWDDYKYKGRKPYRNGVQLVLGINESPLEMDSLVPVTKEWTVIEDGIEKKLDSLWYNIPYVEHDITVIFRYTIRSADGKIESISEKTITVNPPDKNK